MSWNDPGGDKRDPWGGGGRDQGPPDLDEVFKKLQDRINRLFGRRGGGNGKSSGGGGANAIGIGLIAAVLLVVWLASGIFVVEEGRRGVVLRFGELEQTSGPGMHWHWPYPIGSVYEVNVAELRTVRIGQGAGVAADEALMLTRDRNVVFVQAAVQWRIADPAQFLFTFIDPEQTLAQLTESALREVVGNVTAQHVLTGGRSEIEETVEGMVREVLEEYRAGVEVVEIVLTEAQFPEPVQEAVADVTRADQDAERVINQAQAYRERIMIELRGRLAQIAEGAEAYTAEKVAQAEGEASRFLALLEEYQDAPAVTRERLYLETLEGIFANNPKVLVGGDTNTMPYLPLDRLLRDGAQRPGVGVEPVEPAANGVMPESPVGDAADRARLRNREAR